MKTSIGNAADDPFDEQFDRSFKKLLASLREVPVEDGILHEGEKIIAAILGDHDQEMLANKALGIKNEFTKASVMRLMGWVSLVLWTDLEVRRRLISEGLASPQLQVRDAAMQMVEDWEDPECVDLLKDHMEPDHWLSDYAHEIVEDIVG